MRRRWIEGGQCQKVGPPLCRTRRGITRRLEEHVNLQEKIAEALSKDASAADLSRLIVDVEVALELAREEVASVRAKTMDAIEVPDPNEAQLLIERAEFARDRL